ncbi:hypothetical protein HYH03_017886 [Edaphochlamys debaryana]|uniref:SET domain-containing protein n=1 Tax=Edaphochlamys debaryana TaxID=47281 RepID=A0A835XNA2_9CHLO|nr:hypothetical protein HYH03_017886 [Edaphochlamys debaryana]|eukprot:KAG2483229.1 hypothetical protein HYH03_017886 [Edaphochlamys debaryana]
MADHGARTISLSPVEAATHLRRLSRDETHVFLRQAFVNPEDPRALCVNPTDPGRFVNHSPAPNLLPGLTGGVAVRDIAPGEELTCDYGGLASPPWYQALCDEYGVLSTADVVTKYGST